MWVTLWEVIRSEVGGREDSGNELGSSDSSSDMTSRRTGLGGGWQWDHKGGEDVKNYTKEEPTNLSDSADIVGKERQRSYECGKM